LNRIATTLAFVGLAACSDPELEQRIKDLEAKIDALEKRGPAAPGAPGAAAAASTATPEQEQAAAALLKSATEALDAMDFDGARAKVAEIKSGYADTRAAKAVQRLDDDLQIIGKDEAPFKVETWYQGSEADLKGKATLYVFWEVWCPHCKREVPKLSETYTKYGKDGFKVVGITRQTKNITDDQVKDFIKETNVNYPIAKDSGEEMSRYYGVRGIPAAAVVKDGKVVWRGHPGKVTDELINKWMAGS
jgi:peroxiredoxin